jgi:catechol 2,3-dioxygenase-like lactoylglutathione lyase family enzyme
VNRLIPCLLACVLASCTTTREEPAAQADPAATPPADASRSTLGNFSVSLSVKDLAASRAFYESLGFRSFGGDPANGWLILQNETATIGLFQGMFEGNLLTFNPGWDRSAHTLPHFADVRELQQLFKSRGLKPTTEADESSSGPASFMLKDPDGNVILVDQHVPRPAR